MPFEFLGGDLQTDEGRDDFIAYGLALQIAESDQAEEVYEIIGKLSNDSPEDAAKLLQQLYDEYEERWDDQIRSLSSTVISHLTKVNSILMADTLSGLLKRGDDTVEKRAAKMKLVEEDIFAEDVSQEDIGLSGLAKISRAYLSARDAQTRES